MHTLNLTTLAERLRESLRAAYDEPAGPVDSAQPLRSAFVAFGRDSRRALLPLEDVMAAGVDVLQWLLNRNGSMNEFTGPLSAGIALASLSRAYHAEQLGSHARDERSSRAPRSWLEALHRVNRSATENLDLPTRLETSVRVVAETIGADACALSLFDEASGMLVMRAAVGLNQASVGSAATKPGAGISGRAALEGRIIAAPDARRHPAYSPMPSSGKDLYASQISVPMLIRSGNEPGRLVGVLDILSIERRDVPPDEIAFLETLAGELAISIENARLYSRTDARLQQKITELGTLQRVSHAIASSLDLNAVLRSIAEQAVLLINVDAATIYRMPRKDSDSVAPKIEFRVGQTREVLDEPGRDGAITEVLRTGSAQAIDIDYVDGSGRLFCLPLRSARETLGALCLRLNTDAELSEDQLGLLQTFSDSATLAIENATLYQDAVKGYETASALLQEMHHRVRNNLQTVAALLSLQLRNEESASWSTPLREAISRVQAIAGIHDLLSDESRLTGATVDVIAKHVASEAHRTLIPPGLTVEFDIAPSTVQLPSKQSTVLALLINELVANAVRHGFKDRTHGKIRISASTERQLAVVQVENDGASPPANFDPNQSTGLGMRIIERLVTSDLRGRFTIQPSAVGALAMLVFPLRTDPDEI